MTDLDKEIEEYAKRKRRRQRRLGAKVPPGFVPVAEWARLHGLSTNKVYTLMHHCKLDYIKVNGKLLVHLDAKIIITEGRKHGYR